MPPFDYIDDVKDWLEPLGYDAFWQAVMPLGLFEDEDRAHCDQCLHDGVTDMGTMMEAMKAIAKLELTIQLDLQYRPAAPPPYTPQLTDQPHH